MFGGSGLRRPIFPGVVAVLIGALVLMIASTDSRFADATTNEGNAIAAGRVDLELPLTTPIVDGTIEPGASVSSCVELTYTGDVLPAEVRLNVVDVAGHAVRGVRVTIESSPSCRDREAIERFDGTVDGLLSATDWTTGIVVWSPSATGDAVAIRTETIAANDATGGPLTFAARWEARPGSSQ